MGLLNLKKKKAPVPEAAEEAKEKSEAARKLAVSAAAKSPVPSPASVARAADAGAIIRTRVTEKAGVLSAEGREVRVFEVSRFATKRTVSEAVRSLYKVSPEKVAILKVPAKKSMTRGRVVRGKTGRKAYVYLRPGEKIDLA